MSGKTSKIYFQTFYVFYFNTKLHLSSRKKETVVSRDFKSLIKVPKSMQLK